MFRQVQIIFASVGKLFCFIHKQGSHSHEKVMKSHGIWILHSRPGKVLQIQKICLGHGKVVEFQIFPKIVFSWWLKHWKIFCVNKASTCSPSGTFHSLFSPVSLSILRSWNWIKSHGKVMEFSFPNSVWTLINKMADKMFKYNVVKW